jgi:2-polyprenyl-6-methoxyphenol hydroxylase-like FAD-dependent oxidoreductase
MRILISGAGIAGATLAYWLLKHGFQPTLLERAPRLRTGGYLIDFWGTGFDVAERMGLAPALRERGYYVKTVRMVGDDGRPVGGFPVKAISRLANNRFVSLPRGDLASAIYELIEGRVETVFDDSITALRDTGSEVEVDFERTQTRKFDLVLGADGLHSNVRRFAFGTDVCERYLGLKIAVFESGGYRPRDEDVYFMYNRPGLHVSRFSLRGDRTMFLFIFIDERVELPDPTDLTSQKKILRERFGRIAWEVPQILEALGSADSLYFDRVSQIRMRRWSHGRVALVGDAACCVSLLAGQGSSLAMAAAYVLAGEIAKSAGQYEQAFAAYQDRLGGLLLRKQEGALRMKGFFVPRSRLGVFLRNQISKVLTVPFIAEPLIARDLLDRIELPTYRDGAE